MVDCHIATFHVIQVCLVRCEMKMIKRMAAQLSPINKKNLERVSYQNFVSIILIIQEDLAKFLAER